MRRFTAERESTRSHFGNWKFVKVTGRRIPHQTQRPLGTLLEQSRRGSDIHGPIPLCLASLQSIFLFMLPRRAEAAPPDISELQRSPSILANTTTQNTLCI